MNPIKSLLTEEKVKDALVKVMRGAVNIYAANDDSIAKETIVFGTGVERYMFVIWPGDIVDLNYASSTLGITDIGDRIASFDTGYFTIDSIVRFTIEMIKALEGIE